MKAQKTCNGGDRARSSRRGPTTGPEGPLPQREPGGMLDLANEADPKRTTGDSDSAEDSLGSARHRLGDRQRQTPCPAEIEDDRLHRVVVDAEDEIA